MFGSLWSGPGFIGSLVQSLSFGGFRGSNINYVDEVGELTSSSLCMAVWQYMATALTEAPPTVKAYEKGSTHGEIVPDHPLINLLNQPNKHTDGATLLMAFALDWLFSGDCYWIKSYDRDFQTPTGLWYAPYFMIQPLADERDPSVMIKEYQYIVDGKQFTYLPEEIVHIRRGINPRDLRRGIAVFDSVLREIYTDNQAANFSAVVLKNWGVIPFVISPPKNSKSDHVLKAFGNDPQKAEEQAKRIKTKFIEATTGDNRGGPVVNTIPLEITKLGFSPQELNIGALRQVPESRVAAVTGLPAALLQFLVGLEHGTSYASYKEAREQAYESVIAPLLKIIASGINRQLMPDFGDPKGRRLEFEFDISGVRVLQEDQTKVYERANTGVGGGWMTVADARSMVGLESDEFDKIYLRGGQAVPQGEPMLPPEPEKPQLPPASEEPKPEKPEDENQKLMNAVLLKLLAERNGNGNHHPIIDAELVKGGIGSGNFGHAGRPGLIGGSVTTSVVNKPTIDGQEALQGYLQTIADFRANDKPEGFKYGSIEEFVLDNGEQFTAAALPKEIKEGTLGLCYQNAYQTCEYNSQKELEYVEGFAKPSSLPFPIAHAWAVDKDGNVVDPTWDRLRKKGDTIDYFGVRIPMKTVRSTIFARERYGVLHNPEQGFPLLRDGIEEKGGAGSGHFGHSGRPGVVGGSIAMIGGAVRRLLNPAPIKVTKPTDLDKRLSEYKPDPVNDAEKTQHIVEMLNTPFHTGSKHNARLEHYSQIPFLDELHREIGVSDPKDVPIEKYVEARNNFFNQLPIEDVPLDNIVVTQEFINRERVHKIIDHPELTGIKLPHLVKYRGDTYVIEGHNRVAAQVLQFKPSVEAHVWDLGWKERHEREFKGGAGSGNFGHEGRPGMIGGSASSGMMAAAILSEDTDSSEVESLVSDLWAKGGFTYSPTEHHSPETGFVVSLPREEGMERPYSSAEFKKNALQLLTNHLKETRDGIASGRFSKQAHAGAWVDSSTDRVVLDVSEVFDDEEAATNVGRERQQDAIYDIGKGVVIDLRETKGYSGEADRQGDGRGIRTNGRRDAYDTRSVNIYLHKGGEGSGHFGHSGRPGLVGGSESSGSSGGIVAGDRKKFYELKSKWAKVNNELLSQLDSPNNIVAQQKMNELKQIVKDMYRLKADAGGLEGIGLPGGPRDVVIIGAGPGGLSAAVMGGTDGLDTLLIDGNTQVGGQAKFSTRIENFPGFPIGITGEKLAQNMFDQAERVGADTKLGVKVTGITYNDETGIKTLTLSNGDKIESRSVIIAGGVEFGKMSFEGADSPSVIYADPKKLSEIGSGKNIVVVGGSNGAAQAALGAAQHADYVTVLSRSPISNSMSDYQQSALRNHPKISVIEGDQIDKLVLGNDRRADYIITKNGQKIECGAVGIFIGGQSNTRWLPSSIRLQGGQIDVNHNLETTMPGVFAVGDIRRGSIGRIGGAVGDGQLAARNLFEYFNTLKNKP